MQVDYELTKQDYIAFNIFHMTYSASLRKSLFVQRYIISLIFLIVPFILARFTVIPLWYWLMIFGLVYLLWAGFYWKYLKWTLTRRISRLVDEGQNADMLGRQTLKLAADGIVNITGFSESKTNYGAVEGVIETQEYIYIYLSAVMAYIIPVDSFADSTQKAEFINRLNGEIEKNKHKGNSDGGSGGGYEGRS
ncbi:MAG: YcxB family protein [Peptococcaceae bacterium]